MKKRIISLFITLAMCITFIPVVAFADDNAWTNYAQAVTETDGVYEISTAAQLAYIAKGVNDGTLKQYEYDSNWDLNRKIFRLTADIDLSAHKWVPIGVDRNHGFQGMFDGNGYTISGMRIGSADTPYVDGYYVGLFGYATGVITDVKIRNSGVYAAQQDEDKFETYAGLLVGDFNGYSTSITNCDISGSVYTAGTTWSNNQYGVAGGIVGDLDSGIMDSCRADVTLGALDGARYFSLGGIAACAGEHYDVTIKNCVANVQVDMPSGDFYDYMAIGAIYAYGKNAINCIGRIDCDGANKSDIPTEATTYNNVCVIETNLKVFGSTSYNTYGYVPLDARYTYYGSDGMAVSKTDGEIKSDEFLQTLNTAAEDIEGAKAWSIESGVYGGFPNIKKAGVHAYYDVEFISFDKTYATKKIADGFVVATPDEPLKDGYTFLYWYKDDENEPYNFSTPVEDNLTLYAKWDAHSYTVLFDSAGGSYVYPQSVKQDQTITLPEVPEKKGSAFGGWYTDKKYENAWNFEDTVSDNMTLYARWTDEDGVPVAGRITDAATKDGISGATVTLSNGQNAIADEFGYYRIANVADGTYTIRAAAPGYGEALDTVFAVAAAPASYDAALTKNSGSNLVSVYANITCVYSGITLGGVKITAVGAGDLGTYTQYTNAKGHAEFTGLPQGSYTFHINETGRPGWESYVSEAATLTGDYALNCALKPNYEQLTVTVTGYDPVTEAQNAPMAGKKVKLTGLDPKDNKTEIINLDADTDENGAVTFEKIVPVTWKVTCSDPCYEKKEEVIYSDASGHLTKNTVALTLPFIDSPVTVSLSSVYSDPDIFKKSGGNGTAGSKFSDDGRSELNAELVGMAGTLTEGIIRKANIDENGEANFTGLFPGTYRITASGSAKRYVTVLSGDNKEIYSSTENTRYGPKYFYADFDGTGTATAALGKNTKATVKVTPTPVTFSGTLYKSDMNEDGTITTAPVPNTKIVIKPSAYYQQNGEAAAGHEITTDENGFYSVSLAPGLYGVEVDEAYKDYFGGHLIYHSGATDTCYYDYNVRGWPCFERWTGTRASAWAWLSSGTQQPYGDIAGMNLSSGNVVADLEMMEKQFTYLLGDANETASGVGIGMETAAEMHMITGFEKNPIFDDENKRRESYYHIFKTSNYHTESRGATVAMTGTKNQTLNMTGEKFPAIFNELDPGEYTFTYTLGSVFSHLELSDWTNQTRERLPYNGTKSFTFYDFPAPGKLPDASNPFPEDYVDIKYPDDKCKNPWPLSTVADTQVTVDFDQDAKGHRTFYDLYDNDESNGELHFKFYDLDWYTSEYIDLSKEEGQARLQYMKSHPELFGDLHVCNITETTLASVNEDNPLEFASENEQTESTSEESSDIELMADSASGYTRYEYIPEGEYAHMQKDLVRDDDKGYIMAMLFAYSTDKIPGKLFYTGQPRPGYYRRDQWDDQSFTAIPDGNVTLYFCTHNYSNWDYYVLQNQGYHRNQEKHPDLCFNDLWFSVELKDSGAINCFLDFLNPENCSEGTHILSQSEINNLLNPRTIKVKAVESGNVDNELDVPVSVTTKDNNVFSTGQTYPEQTSSSAASAVTVNSDEWECPNPGMITGEYDEATKTETIIVPLTRKQYVYNLSIKDDAGNPVQNADITFAGKRDGGTTVISSKADGSAQAGTVTHYSWSNTDEISGGLTYQKYTITVLAQGYDGKRVTISGEDIVSGAEKMITLNRISQPTIDAEKVSLDKKGAFLPGVNYSGSSNAIDFVTSIGDDNDKFYLRAEGEIEVNTSDGVKEFYLVDKRAFKNKDFSDVPEAIEIPSAAGAGYNPSAVFDWLDKLEKGSLGNVYYQRINGDSALSYIGKGSNGTFKYSFLLCVPLWELPPDGFEPTIIAVTNNNGIQIHNFTYSENDPSQLVGMRLSDKMAQTLNNISMMANIMAFGGEAAKKLDDVTLPTGSLSFMPDFTASVKQDNDGYLTYNYTLKASVMQGANTVSNAKSAYMSVAPRKLGLQMTATLSMDLEGKERKMNEGFNLELNNGDLQLKDYVPTLFDSLPIKVDFDENKPLSGTSYMDFSQIKDKNNANIKTQDTIGLNGKLYLTAEASAFKALSLVPTVGPVLMSLEKSGALDMGAKMSLATGADGSYTVTRVGDDFPAENADFTIGAGAGLGFYAKAFGGALGAESSVALSGDNKKLQDMVTVTATIDEDGFHMKEVQGKLTADAKIYIKTWFVNGQKDFNFGSIPFKYQFGTETQFVLQEISVNDNMKSRNDFDTSTFNGRAETVVDNLLPISGYATDERNAGTFVYSDMSSKGGNVRLMLSEYQENDVWKAPVKIVETDGLIPSSDVISLGDGRYLAVWSEIAKADMEKTCPPSVLKYSIGTVNNGSWSGNVQALDTLGSEVATKLVLTGDENGVSLAALKTAEGSLAQKWNVSGYKFNGTSWSSATDLAKNQELYDISACAADGALVVAFVTEDNKLHALTWKNNVTEETFDAYGQETALASDGTSAYLISEAKKGLAMYAWNGEWTPKQYAVTSTLNPGNLTAAVEDNNIIVSWTGDNDTKLYSAIVKKSGRVISTDNEIKTSADGRFADSNVFVSDGAIHVMTVLDGDTDKLNVYGGGTLPMEDDGGTHLVINSVVTKKAEEPDGDDPSSDNPQEDTTQLTLSIESDKGEEIKGTVFATLYDAQNTLTGADVEAASDQVTLNLNDKQTDKYIKIFWWDGLNTMRPLAEPTVINIDDIQ